VTGLLAARGLGGFALAAFAAGDRPSGAPSSAAAGVPNASLGERFPATSATLIKRWISVRTCITYQRLRPAVDPDQWPAGQSHTLFHSSVEASKMGDPLKSTRLHRARHRSHAAAGLLAALALGGLVVPAFAAGDQPPTAPSAETAGVPNSATAMTQVAAQAGVLSCAGRIEQVARFLGAGNQISFLFLMPPPPRDQRLVALAMEIANKDAPSAYGSAEFAASAQGCGASYETVTYWPVQCEAVVAKYFPAVRKAPALGKSFAALDAGGNTRIFLMPAGAAGCVTIKKELL
jgi:hypothetical protein